MIPPGYVGALLLINFAWFEQEMTVFDPLNYLVSLQMHYLEASDLLMEHFKAQSCLTSQPVPWRLSQFLLQAHCPLR